MAHSHTSRLITSSFVIAILGCGVTIALGQSIISAIIVIVSVLLCTLVCSSSLSKLVATVRKDQYTVIKSLQVKEDLSSLNAEPNNLKAFARYTAFIIDTIEKRRKERHQLLDQIIGVEEQLKSIAHNLMSGDVQEVAQVKDAVAAMENMNKAFTTVIEEIDELSSRTEDRASISAEMSVTTDAIAENINQYSAFVIENSSSVEEMARAIKETADNIRGLSSSTEQTVSAITQISTSQNNVRENAERGATASGNVRNQAEQGIISMDATMRAIQEIVKSNDESFESINRLSHHSARVGNFLNVIQEVVEQTNLLSLNASIIAAQAGERGKAFAVVAEEVRSLAHRTSASTKEIEELVRNIQKETAAVQRSVSQGKDKAKEGVKISQLANVALTTIEQSAEEASQMVAQIALETSEQANSIQSISDESEKNLERVRQITLATEHQQEGTKLIVNNLEQMRELAHRVNASAQEQAKGNRLYLRSVMEDNERARALKEDASQHIAVVSQAVDAVSKVDKLITINAQDSRKIMDGVSMLANLIDNYRTGTIVQIDGVINKDLYCQ